MRNIGLKLSILAVGLLVWAGSAQAAIMTYSDKATFLAAIAASPTVVDFDDLAGGTGYKAYAWDTFFGPGNDLQNKYGALEALSTAWGEKNYNGGTAAYLNGWLMINLPYSAFGMDVMHLDAPGDVAFKMEYTGGSGSPLQVNISSAPTAGNLDGSLPRPTPKFFGIIGTEGELFTKAALEGGATTVYFDNVILGQYVPEPATMALLALGGVGMLVRRRRR